MTVVINDRGGDPEKLVKRFIKKVKKAGIIEEVISRRYYVKPSAKKRLAKKRQIAEHKKLMNKTIYFWSIIL